VTVCYVIWFCCLRAHTDKYMYTHICTCYLIIFSSRKMKGQRFVSFALFHFPTIPCCGWARVPFAKISGLGTTWCLASQQIEELLGSLISHFVFVTITSSSGNNKRCAPSPWAIEKNPTTLVANWQVSKESVTRNTLKLNLLLVGSENHFGSAGPSMVKTAM
jgi:hypothetical protein